MTVLRNSGQFATRLQCRHHNYSSLDHWALVKSRVAIRDVYLRNFRLNREFSVISGWTGNFDSFSIQNSVIQTTSWAYLRAFLELFHDTGSDAQPVSCPPGVRAERLHVRNLRLKITCKSLSILVIISGICQGLEIEGITVATLQMTYESMTINSQSCTPLSIARRFVQRI